MAWFRIDKTDLDTREPVDESFVRDRLSDVYYKPDEAIGLAKTADNPDGRRINTPFAYYEYEPTNS